MYGQITILFILISLLEPEPIHFDGGPGSGSGQNVSTPELDGSTSMVNLKPNDLFIFLLFYIFLQAEPIKFDGSVSRQCSSGSASGQNVPAPATPMLAPAPHPYVHKL